MAARRSVYFDWPLARTLLERISGLLSRAMHSLQLPKQNQTKTKYGDNTMNQGTYSITHLAKDESGQGLIEYALIAGLIGLVAVVAMTATGSQISAAFNSISNSLASAI